MDTATLVSALQHTLNPDKATRQQAEAALSQVRAACLSFSRDEESPRGPAASRRRLARNAATLRSGSPCRDLFEVLEGYEPDRGPRGIRTSGDSVEEVEKNFELPAALFSLPPTSPEKIVRLLIDNCVDHLSIL